MLKEKNKNNKYYFNYDLESKTKELLAKKLKIKDFIFQINLIKMQNYIVFWRDGAFPMLYISIITLFPL